MNNAMQKKILIITANLKMETLQKLNWYLQDKNWKFKWKQKFWQNYNQLNDRKTNGTKKIMGKCTFHENKYQVLSRIHTEATCNK
jgi:hypothetical protein